MQPNRFSDH